MMNSDPLIGRRLANFQIDGVIGRGGMAQVYHGLDMVLQRPVAIKVIDTRYRDNPAYARRFVKEAQAVATWRHENIIQIYYADEEAGLSYFAMEYIDGLDLGKFLTQHSAAGQCMPYSEVLRIGRAVAQALDYAHHRGVIHRDVKPSNVILANDGRVVLTDFGLAMDMEQGSLGEVFGTARYTAPEQARRSSDAIPQSDLYSVGVILYEMLTGVTPFDDPSPTSMALQHMTLPPPPPRRLNPDLTEATERVLLKALSKNPRDRYPTGLELMAALESALQVKHSIPAKQSSRHSLPASAVQPPAPYAQSPRQLGDAVAGTTTSTPTQRLPSQATRPEISQGWRPARYWRYLLFGGIVLMGVGVLIVSQRGGASLSPTLQPGTVAEAKPPSSAPTSENIGVPVATAWPAATASSAMPIMPTVLYPNGRRFVILYNDSSLYMHNAASTAGALSSLAFEQLDASAAVINRFEGWRWSQHYPRVEIDSCARIEIRGSSPYLRPAECQGRYNSSITASRDDSYVFWIMREDSSQFRVLWNKQEVARCEIAAGVCEVFLP
ncbi:eukaryotic-like serine/threonine-protein kinase [Thermoflexales bacterium]|nr:eukaryotic-like serine/threonine-protein kinase [Thermoflexales bacterium]